MGGPGVTPERQAYKLETERRLARIAAETKAERLAAGQCRHCGGSFPCWSPWGDVRLGVTYQEALRRRRRPRGRRAP